MGELIHFVGHGLLASDIIQLGNLVGGDGLYENTSYYVLADGLTADDFKVSLSDGGVAETYTTDITDGVIVAGDEYITTTVPAMEPPSAVPGPSAPTLSSVVTSGIVRLVIELNDTGEAKVRAWEINLTHLFEAGGDPDWTEPSVITLPSGSTEYSIPALGNTVYAVRVRAQDVYGNYSTFSTASNHTTLQGSDALAAALADLANDVSDGVITETKIADNAISTPKLQANSVTAEVLAATIVLASLIKTADTGRRIEIDTDGIRLFDASDGLLVRIPTNGDPVYVKGEVSADSLISQSTAEFRTLVSLAASTVATLQNGISAPSVAPTVAASLDYLTLTTTPPNLYAGIGYDSGAGTYWVGANPSVSDYVAHEYDITTGIRQRSITKTGSFETYTTTYGSTSHISDTAEATSDNAESQIAVPITMPRDGRITKVSIYLRGYTGSASVRNCVWSSGGTLLDYSSSYTASTAALGTGNSIQYNKTLSDGTINYNEGQTYKVGAMLVADSDAWQWDHDDGSGKTTYVGSGENFDDFTVTRTDTNSKPNVYITYEYDVDTVLEGYTAGIVGVARAGAYIWVLEATGILYQYDQSDLTYVAQFDHSSRFATSVPTSLAGLFYDGTNLIITTANSSGGSDGPRFIKVNAGTGAYVSTLDGSSTAYNGSTDYFRGGCLLNDPLNGNEPTYWVPITGQVKAFKSSDAASVANREFGSAASVANGLTHDGTVFRGWAVATPTKVWKFTAWDWSTASAIYWFCYAWYDSAGTTHETVVSPRSSLTLRRRERVQVQNPAIPTGGADDPDKARVYMAPNATDPGATAFKLQVTDALTTRYLTDYASGGAADGGGTPFAAGTPATLGSGGTGFILRGSGLINRTGTAFPSGPVTGDHYYRSDVAGGIEFRYDGTRWVCTCLHQLAFPNEITNLSASSTDISRVAAPVYATGTDIWVVTLGAGYHVAAGTALSASHKWTVDIRKTAVAGAQSSVVVKTIDSGSSAAWRRDADVAVGALIANPVYLYIAASKTGTPGNLYFYPTITYRIVAT